MTRPHADLLAAMASMLLLTACLLGTHPCSDSAAAEFRSLDHYRGLELEPQPHVTGACNATFVTADDPNAVLEAYRSELEASGYTIGNVSSTPVVGENETIVGQEVYLDAESDSFFASVSAVVFDGQEATYNVFVDDLEEP
jgi:hypothetical protein